jgi:histidinol-phosphate aminotransferase
MMIETGHAGASVIDAMKAKNVYIGRVWPIWPKAVRISVGTPQEMEKFKVAFKAVMDDHALAAAKGAPLTAVASGPQMQFPHLS